MKIKELTKRMNDYGTRPRVRIMKHHTDCAVLIYEGKPNDIPDEIGNMKLNSFTVYGVGFLEINTSAKTQYLK